MADHDPDYWYENRHRLECAQVFRTYDGAMVKLDHRKPGDGTQWVVASWYDGYFLSPANKAPAGWCYDETAIEPGDLRGLPLPDPALSS